MKLLIVALTLCVVSCATTSPVSYVGLKVNALKDQNFQSEHYSFQVLPASSEVNKNDLTFREFAEYVNRAMEKLGHKKSSNPEVTILLSYGLADPKTQIFQTSISSASASYDRPSNTIYTVGQSVTSTTSTTKWTKIVRLEGVLEKSRRSKDLMPVWSTTIASFGSNTDLRAEMPILIAGAMPYIGKDTKTVVNISKSVSPRDPLLRYLIKDTNKVEFLPTDLIFLTEQCKSIINKEGKCSVVGFGSANIERELAFSGSVRNESEVVWSKPMAVLTCYQMKYPDPNDKNGKSEKITTHTAQKTVDMVVPSGQTAPMDLQFKVPQAYNGKDQKCEMRIAGAQEVPY